MTIQQVHQNLRRSHFTNTFYNAPKLNRISRDVRIPNVSIAGSQILPIRFALATGVGVAILNFLNRSTGSSTAQVKGNRRSLTHRGCGGRKSRGCGRYYFIQYGGILGQYFPPGLTYFHKIDATLGRRVQDSRQIVCKTVVLGNYRVPIRAINTQEGICTGSRFKFVGIPGL